MSFRQIFKSLCMPDKSTTNQENNYCLVFIQVTEKQGAVNHFICMNLLEQGLSPINRPNPVFSILPRSGPCL